MVLFISSPEIMGTQLKVFHAYVAVFLLYFSSFVSSSPVSKVNAAATPRYVFAHFMVGIVQDYTLTDWKTDMSYAQEIGIDAFALNCASIDSYTPTQLALAYQAASEVGFHVFISFDFAYWNNGNTNNITDYMNKYASHPGQMQYNGGAVVSTFVGDSFNWAPVKAGTNHSIFAIPMMQDPIEVTYLQTGFDGAFSWLAWPTDGGNSIIPGPMTTVWDDKFLKNLAGKPYMAPVSPWFSTHFNSKNWVFISEELITDRWNQMLTMQPALIEIISWNDYGESHYIAPAEPHHTDDGSSQWADGFPHDGWRIISKPYIAAYKAGATTPSITQDQLVYWYRPTPKGITCTNDTLGPPNGIQYLADEIFVTTLLKSPATLIVTSGSNTPVAINVPAGIVTTNFTMGVGNQYFQVTRNGSPILSGYGGLNIANTCQKYNFNAYVGSLNGTSNAGPPPGTTTSTSSQSTTTSTSTSSTSTPPPTTTTTSTSTSTTSTSTSTTSTSTKPTTTSTSTSTSTSSTSSPTPTQPSVCIAGTGPGNYIGLCSFCCNFGYCPPGPCTCTAYGAQVPAPPTTGQNGYPLPGEDNSYLGLCSYACNHGYCPETACRLG
ncbi:Glycoside hydrolase family 71 protein [Rutstroemia sp. NJR-2017a BVV2]|nr:Glycoside hydrolase family 71 protein [Rutstroemia sp. NJR-2017a BVV2]